MTMIIQRKCLGQDIFFEKKKRNWKIPVMFVLLEIVDPPWRSLDFFNFQDLRSLQIRVPAPNAGGTVPPALVFSAIFAPVKLWLNDVMYPGGNIMESNWGKCVSMNPKQNTHTNLCSAKEYVDNQQKTLTIRRRWAPTNYKMGDITLITSRSYNLICN